MRGYTLSTLILIIPLTIDERTSAGLVFIYEEDVDVSVIILPLIATERSKRHRWSPGQVYITNQSIYLGSYMKTSAGSSAFYCQRVLKIMTIIHNS